MTQPLKNMKLQSNKTHQKGFTLVELLAVTAIVTTLFTIASVIILRHIHSSKDIEAAVMAQHFALISEKWEEDMYAYPHASSLPNSPEFDEAYLTGDNSMLMSNMLGQNASVNKDMVNYLSAFPTVADGEGGLVLANINGNPSGGGSGNAATKSLMDPWGNPFIVLFDHDLDGNIEAPVQKKNDEFLGAYAGNIWRNCSVVMISAGRNGLFDKDKDIVYKY